MENIIQLENRLWEAADQLRTNSKLTSTEYCMPVLGLIFLRHAYNRFLIVKSDIEKNLPKRDGKPRPVKKTDFTRKAALFLQDKSQFDFLLNLPQDKDKGQAVIEAMDAIEQDYDSLRGILPKDYHIFDNDLLSRLLKIFNDQDLRNATGDVFGHIYQYFLDKFAAQGAIDNGEFFTPPSLVQTIVNVIEPEHGLVFDPACGSGGMFVQSSHFIERLGKKTHEAVTFKGQEKTATTIKIAKMNLAVHGLEGNILEGNTFYNDHHNLMGKCDFVMANPPFNTDGVDSEKVKGDPRLPFGLPGVNKKKEVSNGNYLWISYFYSYLSNTGRAGFVMSSQASSAGNEEMKVRQKIVETGHVDVMISIRSNFFYTRTVPCELWFFDRAKPKDHQNKVLMLDARNIYQKVTRKIYNFTPEQLKNISTIVWLYRGQTAKFLNLISEYFNTIVQEAKKISDVLNLFTAVVVELLEKLSTFETDLKNQKDLEEAAKKQYRETLAELKDAFALYAKDRDKVLGNLKSFTDKTISIIPTDNKSQHKAASAFESISENLRDLTKQVDHIYKLSVRCIDQATKDLNARQCDTWDNKAVNKLKKDIDPLRKKAVEQIKLPVYFYRQIHWLQLRFPDAQLVDVPGLVKLTNIEEIEKNDWSLTPGRYVGVAPIEEDPDFNFTQTMTDIHTELADLNKEAIALAQTIQSNFEELGI
jgi:type I restriction enzyme M protein